MKKAQFEWLLVLQVFFFCVCVCVVYRGEIPVNKINSRFFSECKPWSEYLLLMSKSTDKKHQCQSRDDWVNSSAGFSLPVLQLVIHTLKKAGLKWARLDIKAHLNIHHKLVLFLLSRLIRYCRDTDLVWTPSHSNIRSNTDNNHINHAWWSARNFC